MKIQASVLGAGGEVWKRGEAHIVLSRAVSFLREHPRYKMSLRTYDKNLSTSSHAFHLSLAGHDWHLTHTGPVSVQSRLDLDLAEITEILSNLVFPLHSGAST